MREWSRVDPLAGEEASTLCRLTIFQARMNVDLAMGDELLEKTGTGFQGTNCDGDAFFVRHAHFTGADDRCDKLRRALRADVSDEAWATVNSSVSRLFPRPSTGKVAVKVINHDGDEVMKVFGV